MTYAYLMKLGIELLVGIRERSKPLSDHANGNVSKVWSNCMCVYILTSGVQLKCMHISYKIHSISGSLYGAKQLLLQ